MVAGSSPARGASYFKELPAKLQPRSQQISRSGQPLGQQFRKLDRAGFANAQQGRRSMKCPHCAINFHDDWAEFHFLKSANSQAHSLINGLIVTWGYRSTLCPNCKDLTIEIQPRNNGQPTAGWRRVYPVGANRGPVPADVPKNVGLDYLEACAVLPLSAKASAALSRRCLQTMLHAHGYKDRDLAREIDLLLNETDPRKALPHKLQTSIDAIRNFGNFSAHPIDDKTTLQVIDVDDHEAEWCLQITEDLFEHFYVGPAAAKAMKDSLNAKLAAAGKPPAK
jgi:hypothetical protein